MSSNHLNRREFIRTMAWTAGGLALSPLACVAPPRDKRMNIVLLVAEDIGPQLGCYGESVVQTPRLDNLASQGVRFTRAFTTQASCSPSRSSILTGLYPHQNGQVGLAGSGYAMNPNIRTIPSVLKASGYRTGIIGKLHVEPENAFDFDWRGPGLDNDLDAASIANAAGRFFTGFSATPFFLMVSFREAHRPFIDRLPAQQERLLSGRTIAPLEFLGIDTSDLRAETTGFYRSVMQLDRAAGLVLDKIAKAGLAGNTMVIFIADHGPAFSRAKCTCYEAGLHIPMIVRWPGQCAPGATVDGLTSVVDIMPTLMEIAGVQSPPLTAGQSLVPLLKGQPVAWRNFLCAEYTSHGKDAYFPRRSIRDDRYKLIRNLTDGRVNPTLAVDGCGAWAASRQPALAMSAIREIYDRLAQPPGYELYDLEADPYEFVNLAAKPELAEIRKRLNWSLHVWARLSGDALITR